MKEKIKNILENNRKAIIATTSICATLVPTIAHAEGVSVSSTISTSMQQIVTDTVSTIAAIAPIGITVFAAMFAWKKGLQFFKQVTK